MAYTLKLNQDTHDLTISGGKLEFVNGAGEVRQRVKIALWHLFGEYFLNAGKGVPWYEEINGVREITDRISNILRTQILDVPGVIRIVDFGLQLNRPLRLMEVTGSIVTESNDSDRQDTIVLDGITLAA